MIVKLRKYISNYDTGDVEYGWTVFAGNRKKVATSGEGYTSREHAVRMMRMLFPSFELRDEKNKVIAPAKLPDVRPAALAGMRP